MSDTETRFEDGARLAWMAEKRHFSVTNYGNGYYVCADHGDAVYGDTLREAIDNARRKEQE